MTLDRLHSEVDGKNNTDKIALIVLPEISGSETSYFRNDNKQN